MFLSKMLGWSIKSSWTESPTKPLHHLLNYCDDITKMVINDYDRQISLSWCYRKVSITGGGSSQLGDGETSSAADALPCLLFT